MALDVEPDHVLIFLTVRETWMALQNVMEKVIMAPLYCGNSGAAKVDSYESKRHGRSHQTHFYPCCCDAVKHPAQPTDRTLALTSYV